jgi:hypothetical protein
LFRFHTQHGLKRNGTINIRFFSLKLAAIGNKSFLKFWKPSLQNERPETAKLM